MRFPSQYRLRCAADYKKVRRYGRHINCGAFILQLWRREPETKCHNCRLGVIASRRVGNAVKRNRGKRIFREIFRLNQEQLPAQYDLVVILRACFTRYKFDSLTQRFLGACCRKDII